MKQDKGLAHFIFTNPIFYVIFILSIINNAVEIILSIRTADWGIWLGLILGSFVLAAFPLMVYYFIRNFYRKRKAKRSSP